MLLSFRARLHPRLVRLDGAPLAALAPLVNFLGLRLFSAFFAVDPAYLPYLPAYPTFNLFWSDGIPVIRLKAKVREDRPRLSKPVARMA